jgi:DNA-binding transcriptional ArsR family regulator
MSGELEQLDLDDGFDALASPHRREIIQALGLQPCSISQLAARRELSLPAIHKHIKVLEAADLVSRRKIGRTNVLTLKPAALRPLQAWLGQFQTQWASEEATLENYEAYVSREPTTNQEER